MGQKENLHASLFYWHDNHVESFKNKKKKYLKGLEGAVFGVKHSSPMLIDFHKAYGDFDGHVSLYDFENSYERFFSIMDYVLSRGANNLPETILMNRAKEFSIVEDIIKEHYGEKVKVSYGLFGVGKLMKQCWFKVKKK